MRGSIPVASRKQLHKTYLHFLKCKYDMSQQLYQWWQSLLLLGRANICMKLFFQTTLSIRKLALVYVSLGLPDTKLSTERKYYFMLCQNIKSKSIFNKIFNDHSHISYTNWNPSFIKISINYEFKAIQQNETELIVQLWIIMDVFQTES